MKQNEFVVKLIRKETEWATKRFNAKNDLAEKFCKLLGKDYLTMSETEIIISMEIPVTIEYE